MRDRQGSSVWLQYDQEYEQILWVKEKKSGTLAEVKVSGEGAVCSECPSWSKWVREGTENGACLQISITDKSELLWASIISKVGHTFDGLETIWISSCQSDFLSLRCRLAVFALGRSCHLNLSLFFMHYVQKLELEDITLFCSLPFFLSFFSSHFFWAVRHVLTMCLHSPPSVALFINNRTRFLFLLKRNASLSRSFLSFPSPSYSSVSPTLIHSMLSIYLNSFTVSAL